MTACNYSNCVFMFVCETIKISLFGVIDHIVIGLITLVAE